MVVSVDRFLVVRHFKKPEQLGLLKRRKDLTILGVLFIIAFGHSSLSLFLFCFVLFFQYSTAPCTCFEASPDY